MDCYEVTIESGSPIQVEEILRVSRAAPNPIFQESLADYLRNNLGASVKIVGWHYGIKITCIRE